LSLVLFAVIPAGILLLGGAVVVGRTLPVMSGSGAWERVAASGVRAITAAREADLTADQRRALEVHEQELAASLTQARRFRFLATSAAVPVALLALLATLLLALFASRVAGHLSRQLSRPLHEVVGWTELIARRRPLPDTPPRRGAPEFEVLRRRMRKLAAELEVARERELEAERLAAFRETARQVAHELKNPLTPIRFAVERLRTDVPPHLRETVEVLEVESRRLEQMARNFSQFGRLPEGPMADVDVGELARYTARATVPERVPLTVEVEEGVPMVRGHHDALSRALSNVLINAVEACRDGGGVSVRVGRAGGNGTEAVTLSVRDSGCGIPAAELPRIWDPYVTSKAGGTGLGLAIARQTVLAHRGTVDATSVEGEGTEIRFVLPVSGASPEADDGGGRSAES
jgi:signal transduction histidine kinase